MPKGVFDAAGTDKLDAKVALRHIGSPMGRNTPFCSDSTPSSMGIRGNMPKGVFDAAGADHRPADARADDGRRQLVGGEAPFTFVARRAGAVCDPKAFRQHDILHAHGQLP